MQKNYCKENFSGAGPPSVHELIETRYRENDSFRDRDLIHVTQCRMPSKFSDAELLHNIQVSVGQYLTSYVPDMNYIIHLRFFVYL